MTNSGPRKRVALLNLFRRPWLICSPELNYVRKAQIQSHLPVTLHIRILHIRRRRRLAVQSCRDACQSVVATQDAGWRRTQLALSGRGYRDSANMD